jgi:hypothetical protein
MNRAHEDVALSKEVLARGDSIRGRVIAKLVIGEKRTHAKAQRRQEFSTQFFAAWRLCVRHRN